MNRANDARAYRIALVSHCLLNSNSKVYELARHPGMAMEVLEVLNRHDIGVIQLPCPELLHLGPSRWWQVKDMYDTPAYRRFCRQLAVPATDQVRLYRQAGATVVCVLGVDGSPNCGVSVTPRSGEWGGRPREMPFESLVVPGRGVFMEEIDRHMRDSAVEPPPFFGLALEDMNRPLADILRDLEDFLATQLA